MSFIDLIKLEWLKFKSNAVVTLLLGFFFVTTPLLIFMGKELFKNLPPPLPSNDVFYQFDSVWDYQGYVGSFLTFFFLGYLAIYIVTSEVSNKTMRQNIITGMSRKDFFLGKLYSIITLSLLATLLYSISCIIIGIFNTENWDLDLLMNTNWAPLRYFLMCMGYMSFGILIGFFIRRSGLAIFFYYSYVLIIELILKWAISYSIVSKIDLIPNKVVNFWPMNVMEDLMPNPILKLPSKVIQNNDINFDLFLTNNAAIIGSFIYILIFVGLSWWIFKRKDL